MMAVLGIWNRNYLDCATHLIAPYDVRIKLLAKYIQQMDMESNGKSIDRNGQCVAYPTAPQIYGEAGTDCQHSYMQMIHQGTDIVPIDFIAAKETISGAHEEHHRTLLANMYAQANALAVGQTIDEANHNPFQVFQGNRPSSIFLFDHLDAKSLGYLVAMYEHKIFTQGILWNLNSFDQPGVELGKRMALKELGQS
jgi:glucose-6-phosphate isomerase